MIAKWIKTFYQSGIVEVPDDLSEENSRQFVQDAAAGIEAKIGPGENDLEWSGTEFYCTANEEHPPCYLDIHDKDGKVVHMSEWFDI